MNLYDFGLQYLKEKSPQYDLNAENVGVITATDSNTFEGVKTLFASLNGKINFLCYDLGLSVEELEWCLKNGLQTKQIKLPDWKHINKWQTFVKPWFVDDSPFEYTMWVDSDCITVGNLAESEPIQNQQSFFIKHWINQKFLSRNSEAIYKLYPVEDRQLDVVNAGVFGINKKLHQSIVTEWKELLSNVVEDENLREGLACWDEGALNWSLQKNKAKELIIDDYRYNCYASFLIDEEFHDYTQYTQPIVTLKKSTSARMFFKHVLENCNNAFILHFSTCMQNKIKYWGAWN